VIRGFVVLAALLVAGGLAACRDEDQRVVHLDTGKYPGKGDQKPSAQALDSIKNRVATQKF
jgi:hypothetical protein